MHLKHTNLKGEILTLPEPDTGDCVVAVNTKDAHNGKRVAHHFLEPLVHAYQGKIELTRSNKIKIE